MFVNFLNFIFSLYMYNKFNCLVIIYYEHVDCYDNFQKTDQKCQLDLFCKLYYKKKLFLDHRYDQEAKIMLSLGEKGPTNEYDITRSLAP